MYRNIVSTFNRCPIFCSWTSLPSLPTARWKASALCVDQTPDVVLVVGGANGHYYLNCAELLYPSQAGQPWRWRTLSPMHERRYQPGMLLLSGNEETQKIIVQKHRRTVDTHVEKHCRPRAVDSYCSTARAF